MKKKIIAAILATVMATSLLTACGDKGAKEPASAPKAETQASEDTADGGAVSDDVWAQVQERFAEVEEYAAQMRDLYTADQIEANPDIEEAILAGEDIIAQMGKVTQDTVTEEEAANLLDAMALVIEGYTKILDSAKAGTDGAGAANGGVASDASFAELQSAYEALVADYDTVAEYYNSGGTKSEEAEKAMNEAYDLISRMSSVTKENITEEDAVDIAASMILVDTALVEIADSISQ